jgi:hypothetical protein
MANYDAIIQAAAARFNVDPALIRGVIGTESTNNPNAVSEKGATGLMQIMPSNYKALGITDPKDPTQNIMGGTQLLSQLLDSSPDVATALRRYQGGEDRSQWGPVNAAYPQKVFAAGGIGAQPAGATSPTLPGIPTAKAGGAPQSDDAIFAQFSKGGAPAQAQQGPQSDDAIFASLTKGATPAQQPARGLQTPEIVPISEQEAADARAQQAAPPQAQPGGMASFAAGLGRGVQETALGAQQLLGHGLEAIGGIGAPSPTLTSLITGQQPQNMIQRAGKWLVNDVNQGLARGAGEIAPYQAAHPIATGAGELGGSVAATAPLGALAPVARTLPGMAAVGAGLGGATAALAPVDPNSQNFAQDKLKQIGIGAATGGVLSPLAGLAGRIISPNVSPDVQTLLDKGVTPTPGQILGGGFARTEDKLTSVPVLGDMIKNAQQRALSQFNQAAYNEALAPIGQKFAGTVGQDGIEQVGKQIGAVYDNVLPQMQLKVDPQFQADVMQLGQMANGLPDAQQRTFMKILKTQIFDKLGPQANMDGQTLKGVQSELAKTASGYLGDASYDNRQLGAAVSALRDAVDSNLARVNPSNLTDQLANANQAWANFVRLRSAAASTGAANNGGTFTAAQLQAAVRANDKSVGKGAFASGNALMQDLSGAGQRVLGSKYPDSGTVGRGLMSLLAPTGIAAGFATQPVATAATLGGIGLGSLPYTSLGQRAAAALLTSRPQFAQPVGNAVSGLGRLIVPGSLPALLSGNR